ncbi:MAG: hypothetical protein CMH48_10025 [Muricauda sp.]|nr:M56 family metallopeptidase [Allomuricauda sp.]MAU27256.1 hypothetical protein [Allomuricauda sp.]MBC31169.1 hypothetical protein [Allomuricauda sp.]|tara:strand:- start:2870 stop:4603 length:1734 start_codon:yes stop_codon:yes gene_type:complete
MEIFFGHLLKTSVVLVLFILAYHLFLKKETLFTENRLFLISGLLIAVLFPFVTLTKTVTIEPTSAVNSAVSVNATALQSVAADNTGAFNWGLFFLTIYIVGVLYFGIRLLLQLQTIQRVKLNSEIVPEDNFYHVRTPEKIAPFSFFRHIFYHPRQFEKSELQAILAHEKVHAKELHSLDILLTEIILVLQWFNPAVWLYRMAVKQNLEYLADSKTCQSFNDKKFYQYLMLKQALGNHKIAIVNPFFNSLTKKRIVMMNKNQSKRQSVLKMLLVLPVLAGLLVAFNTKEVYVPSDKATEVSDLNGDTSIEVTIDSGTTDEELKQIKEDLAKEGVDLSYTAVRNDKNEIIDLSIQISGTDGDGESFSGNYHTTDEGPIKPLIIYFDDKNDVFFIGEKGKKYKMLHRMEKKGMMVWSGFDEIGEHEDIVIVKEGDKEKIYLNGKEVDEDELSEMEFDIKVVEEKDGSTKVHIFSDDDGDNDEKHVKMVKKKKGKGYDMRIITESDEDVKITEKDGLFVIDTKDNAKALYFIDGKKATAKEVEKLSSEEIETINVWKGDKAVKKFGKKAKDGVVEITTKKR